MKTLKLTLLLITALLLTFCTKEDPMDNKCNCTITYYESVGVSSWSEICCGYDAQGVNCDDAGEIIYTYNDTLLIKEATECQ